MKNLIEEKIKIAEKRILKLIQSNDMKKLSEKEKYQINKFYEEKSKNRLETAKIIYKASIKGMEKGYADYAEVVAKH